MANIFWVANGNGDWTIGADWSSGAVPGGADDAVLGVTGFQIYQSYTVSVTTSIAIDSVLISDTGAELSLGQGGTAAIATGATNAGDVEIQGGGAATLGTVLTNTGTVNLDTQYGVSGSTLAVGGALTNSSTVNIGNGGLNGPSRVSAASLANTGTIRIAGNNTPGGPGQAVLDVAAAAPATWIGTLSLTGQSLLQYGSGTIAAIAQGAEIYIGTSDGFVADASAPGSNSALTGLASNAGDLELQYGALAALAGDFANSGTANIDTATYYGLDPSGESGLTIAGMLANSGTVTIGNGIQVGPSVVSAAALDNTGTINLNGNATSGTADQAVLDIAAAAPASWTGTLSMSGQSLLEFGSGLITDVATGAVIYLATPDGYIADADDTTTNSALIDLATIEGSFQLQYGAALSVAGDLTVTGSIDDDTTTNYGNVPSGGSTLTIAGTLTNSGTVAIGGSFFGDDLLTATSTISAAGLDNTGSIYLTGNSVTGTTKQAVLDIAAAAPLIWTGKLFLSGQSLLSFGSGSVTSIAAGAEIDIATPDGYVADAGTPAASSALTGLTSVAGDFELQYGADVVLAGDLALTGTLELDTANNYADTATGGSLLTIAGTVTNTGALTIGSNFFGANQLTSNSVITAAGLANTGTITLEGGSSSTVVELAALDIAASAPAIWTGTLSMSGQGLLQYGSGSITSVAQGAEIYLATAIGYIADAGATGSNSALTGLNSIAGDFELQYGAAVSLAGDLSVTGSLELDTQTNYGDAYAGGSSLTIAGALVNPGTISIGGAFFSVGGLTATTTLRAATLTNTGGIYLFGNSTPGNTKQAVLTVGSAAPLTWNGTLSINGQALLEYTSGSIGTIAAGAEINLNSAFGYVADASAATSNSALTGLSNDAGNLQVQSGSNLSVTGDLAVSGTLDAGGAGILTVAGTLTNSGATTIGSTNLGAALTATVAALVNQTGGTVNLGGSTADNAALAIAGALTNAGAFSINGNVTATAASLVNGGTLSLGANTGAAAGLSVLGAASNSGMLTVGANAALSVTGAATDSGTLTLGGSLDLAAGLEVTGAGSLVLQGGQVISPNAAAVSVDAGGTVSGNGTILASVANSGAVTASGGVLDLAGPVTGDGTLAVARGGTLELGSAVAAAVDFGGNAGTLKLDQPGSFTGAIDGLAAGDTIDLAGVRATGVSLSGATLTVLAGSSTYEYQVAGPGLAGNAFALQTDGAGGTDILLGPPGPIIDAPAALTAYFGFPSILGALSVSELGGGSGPFTVTITAGNGTLFGAAANAGSVTGSGTTRLVLTGDLAAINVMLAAITYSGTAVGATDTVQLAVSDANGAMVSRAIPVATNAVPVTALVINQPDVVMLIAGEPTALGGLTISDPFAQATGQPLTLESLLIDGSGTQQITGVAATATATGEGTNDVAITGTVQQINDALADVLNADSNSIAGAQVTTLEDVGGVSNIPKLRKLQAFYDDLLKSPTAAGRKAELERLNFLIKNTGFFGHVTELFDAVEPYLDLIIHAAKFFLGGEPHIVTADGSMYNFDAVGEFVLAQSTQIDSSFNVQVRLQPVNGSGAATVLTEIAAGVGDDRVTFAVGRTSTVWLDGTAATFGPASPLQLAGGTVTQTGFNTFVVTWTTGEVLTVVNEGTYLATSIQLPEQEAANSIIGLLGRSGDGAGSDFALPDGTVLPQPLTTADLYGQFADAWRVTDASSILDYGQGQTTATFTDTSFPGASITLAQLPASLVALAAQAVSAAGVTDPGLAAAIEFDYIASGGNPSVIGNDIDLFQGVATTPLTVTSSTPVPAVLGVFAAAPAVQQASTGATAVSFDVYLTAAQATDTEIDYVVTAADAAAFGAAAFGGTLPSGTITIAAGQTTGTITIDVPQAALGALPSAQVMLSISTPSGVVVFAPSSSETVSAGVVTAPAATGFGSAGTGSVVAQAALEYLGTLGTFTQTGNDYTLDLGDISLGSVTPALLFGIANGATAPGDSLAGSFTWPTVAGFQVAVDGNTLSGASLTAPIAAGSSSQALTVTTIQDKFGAQSEVITFNPTDTNASGYSAPLAPITLTIADTLQLPGNITSQAFGDVHIVTYNGLEYDFQSAGQFILAHSTVAGDSFDIQLRLQPYSTSASVTYITQVAIALGTDDVTFSGGALGQPLVVLVDGNAATISTANPVLTLDGGTVTEVSPSLYKVAWDTGESATFTEVSNLVSGFTYLNVSDSLPYATSGAIMGLQGENEGAGNDFQLPDGTVLAQPITSATLYGEYADAWRVTTANSLFTYLPGQSFDLFAHADFPAAPLTLADLPASVVAQAAAVVAAAGVTDPVTAAAAELDYIATGDPGAIASALNVQQQVIGTTAPVIIRSAPPPTSIGVAAAQTSLVESTTGATHVAFTVYLTAAAATDTVVDYAVLAAVAGDLGASAFGGTLPSGAATIAAGQTTAQITIDVPQGALGTQAVENLLLQVSSPGGAVPVFGPTASTAIVNSQPEPGTPAQPVLTYLGTTGTFSFDVETNTYTLDLGGIAQGAAQIAAEFAVINAATGQADQLGGTFTSPSGTGFTITGNSLPALLAAGDSYQGLYALVNTALLGSNTIALTFNPLDRNASGYAAPLAPLTLDITDSVSPAAQPTVNTPSTIIFPNAHVGAAESQAVSVTNSAAAGSAGLDVTLTANGNATASGTIAQLAAGMTDATALSVGLDTSAAGALAGSVTENFVSDAGGGIGASIQPESPYIDLFGSIYRLADASVSPASLTVALGAPGTQTLTFADTDPNDGYSENLIATIVGTTGAVTASGTTGDITPQQTGTLAIQFATTMIGTVGTVTVDLKSDGTGIDGLGMTDLGLVTIPVAVQSISPAAAALTSSGGTLTVTTPNNDTLDLGTVQQGSAAVAVTVAARNAAPGPADDLGGSYAITGGTGFVNTGFGAFTGVDAGSQAAGNSIAVDTTTAGSFTETIVLAPTDSNGVVLAPVTLTVTGTVAAVVAAPTVTSPSVTVAQNAGAIAIGIIATEDASFLVPPTATLGSLPTDGTVALADGTPVTANESLTLAQLQGLTFTATPGAAAVSSTLGYSVTDPAGTVANGTTTLAIGPAQLTAPPTVSSPTLTVAENAGATPIGIIAGEDPSFDTPLLGTLGALPTDGTVSLADLTPVTAGESLTLAQLEGLTFTATPGVAAVSSTLGYSVTDPAGHTAFGTATLAIGAASIPGPTLTLPPPQGGAATTKAISNDPTPIVAGNAASGARLSFTAGVTLGGGTADPQTGAYSTALSTPLELGLNTITAAATTGQTILSSAPVSVFDIPSPVAGISPTDNDSLQFGALFDQGYSLAFVGGTEAATLVDGTLSVGPDTNEAYLQRLYEGLFGRGNDPTGITFWDELLATGATKAAIAADFMTTPEYLATYPAGTLATDSQFVTTLYHGMLGRAPTADNLTYWSGVAAQYGRQFVLADIADSAEAKTNLAATTAQVWARSTDGTLVHELFEAGLGREVELGGLAFWKNTLETALTPQGLAEQITLQPEFVALHGGQSNAAYVTSLYQADFGRTPDAAGAQFWGGTLSSGALDRAGVLLGIATSAESAKDQIRNL